MGAAGSGRPGVHSHRYSTDHRSAYPIAQAIEFIEHTYCTARPFMSSVHVLGIGELLGKILDEGQVPGGLVTDAVIVAACAASMVRGRDRPCRRPPAQIPAWRRHSAVQRPRLRPLSGYPGRAARLVTGRCITTAIVHWAFKFSSL